jgi:hypothetical protein
VSPIATGSASNVVLVMDPGVMYFMIGDHDITSCL